MERMSTPPDTTMTVASAATSVDAPSSKCLGCGKSFASRNAVFKHLKENNGACLSGEDYKNFVRYVRKSVKPPKVVLLYGYLPFNGGNNSALPIIRNGQDAGTILMEVINEIQKEIDELDDDGEKSDGGDNMVKLNRSYGHFSRSTEIAKQDMDTGAITEVMTVRLYPLRADMSLDDWLNRVQKKLDSKFERQYMEESDDQDRMTPIRILGRQDMPNKKFNAEMDVTYRRVEYLLPMDFLKWSIASDELRKQIDALPVFASNHKHEIDHVNESHSKVDEGARRVMLDFKNNMRLLTTRVVQLEATDKIGIMEKEFSSKRLKYMKGRGKKRSKKEEEDQQEPTSDPKVTLSIGDNTGDNPENSSEGMSDKKKKKRPAAKAKKANVLKRKRYHNFTEKSMAHDYLTYRRLDRIYHRATLRFPDDDIEVPDKSTTYLILSLSADLFLTGQVCRVVGVILALANGLIDPDFVDCVFDENYPHLVPTPPAPLRGMISSEVHYATQEGKTKRILSPRVSTRFSEGWNDHSTLRRVKEWQNAVYQHMDIEWNRDGRNSDGRLKAEENWTKNILMPWAEKAKLQLEDYRSWKKNREQSTSSNVVGTIQDPNDKNNSPEPVPITPQQLSVDPTVPEIYREVLQCLRTLDSSGQWPTTSSKRQLVMISTDKMKDKDQQPETLTMACNKAKKNIQEVSSAYSFVEGQGGASGSFSVGYMPGGAHKQPKANSMFPDLVKAAFDLETKLFPEREPSSTIAINRNAQFRPHTDSGAGAGQSTSLIVGLGTYAGGELMVEGEKNDIRYKGIEFDGWKQRHWTMPFQGERFSLVWFTPKGCEGMRGIDLHSQ